MDASVAQAKAYMFRRGGLPDFVDDASSGAVAPSSAVPAACAMAYAVGSSRCVARGGRQFDLQLKLEALPERPAAQQPLEAPEDDFP